MSKWIGTGKNLSGLVRHSFRRDFSSFIVFYKNIDLGSLSFLCILNNWLKQTSEEVYSLAIEMTTFILWIILLFFCWPIAIIALIAYPLVWLLLLPFKLIGISVSAVLDLIKALITLPARMLRGPSATRWFIQFAPL